MGSHIRRVAVLPILALAAAAMLAACGSSGGSGTASAATGGGAYGGGAYGASSSSTTASAASGATVKLVHTSVGKILTNSRGFTLYLFTADRHNSDRCVKKSGCTGAWPPLTVSGHPTAGSGVNKSLLATIRLPNGKHQVVYAGHPLYRYTGDGSPGATSYIGATSFGGTWLAVSASGKAVH